MDRIFGETRIQTIDLGSQSSELRTKSGLISQFLGGRGINQSIILDKGVDRDETGVPRRIILGTGSLTGSTAPGATRMNIDSGNMYNAGIGSGNVGGKLGVYLRFSGYDHLILEGRAKSPQLLVIEPGKIAFADATHLWGKTVSQTDEMLRQSYGRDISALCIGPAGENLVRMASIHIDKYRTQGRCGLGLILGAMKLKAIVVAPTKGKLLVVHPQEFTRVADKMRQKLNLKKDMITAISEGGLLGTMEAWLRLSMPYKNFQDEYLSLTQQKRFEGDAFTKYATKSAKTCFGCSVNCDVIFSTPDGKYPGVTWGGVEGDAAWDFGSNLGILDPEAIIMLHATCTDLGLDIDSTGVCIGWAIESFQRKALTKKDTDGLFLRWNDPEIVRTLLTKIAHREGIGDLLAEGCKKAAEKLGQGSESWAMHMKGQDLAEPLRADKGWALGVAVSPRGGTHLRGAPMPNCTPPLSDPYDPTSYDGQAERVVRTEKLHAANDCLGLCTITSQWVSEAWPGFEDYANLLSAASGDSISVNDLLALLEDIVTLERLYNQIHAGFTRADDYPPSRSMEQPLPRGPLKGQKLKREDWDKMLEEYYQLHDWNVSTGCIPKNKAAEIMKRISKAYS
jgi:aldehyde:ferredoxin oxidoreductase